MKINIKIGIFIIISTILLFQNCKKSTPSVEALPTGATKLEATTQRLGNADAGYQYLTMGDYISSGIPFDIFRLTIGTNSADDLGRTGDNRGVSFAFNAVTSANGVKVVSNNCLSCHADKLNGKVIIGLGNTTSDNTIDVAQQFKNVDVAVTTFYGTNSAEWKAYEPYSRAFKAIGPYIRTDTRGTNPANKIFAALSAHRNKENLTWLTTPQSNIPTKTVITDVPAWWLMKKKNALYYNGLGKGDFARLIMASSLLTMKDSAEARKIDAKFPDVVAYLKSLKAPKNPNTIDSKLAESGKILFESQCSKCHGKYTTDNDYPNLLIDLPNIGTDPALANEYANYPEYHNWHNQGWFSKNPNASQLLPEKGYVAPPLDGIWATAPYLHNSSVPTLEDLLNSSQRPKYWSRTFDNTADYDPIKVGWKYKIEASKVNNNTYDTTLYGYGNGGHTFGDKLSIDERKAVIEYLKTL
jgi:mono/diheme cytochrome c family protein